eukprot:TRINITY_DN7539_c0_g1_i8.p1 TRINITY_DN7539_c0_g1~~TRINITY_DN7539_c0_g1_i8.p1  ORF type:complete len:524 (+),score=55.03 TRINITY_DN7539_c0_g1_i8:186-1757(+)
MLLRRVARDLAPRGCRRGETLGRTCAKRVQKGRDTWENLCQKAGCKGCDECLTTTSAPDDTTSGPSWSPPECDWPVEGAWYVSPDGVDSPTAATFKTVDFAAGLAKPGETIVLLPGEYFNPGFGENRWNTGDTVNLRNVHGAPGAPITITACRAGKSIIRGDGQSIFEVKGSSYVNIFNLTIEGEAGRINWSEAKRFQFAYKTDDSDEVLYRVDRSLSDDEIGHLKNLPIIKGSIRRPARYNTHGLNVHSSHHIEVVGCHIHHAPGAGLKFWMSSHVKARANSVHDNTKLSSLGVHGLLVYHQESMDGDGADEYTCEVTGNHVYDNYNTIYSWNGRKKFVHPVIDEGKGLSVQQSNPEWQWRAGRMLIANNVAHGNGFSGIHLNQADRVDILFNTVVDNHRTGSGFQTGISVQSSADVRVEGNLVSDINDFGGFALSADTKSSILSIQSNFVQGRVGKAALEEQRNTIVGDPYFVDSNKGDYMPKSDLAAKCSWDPAVQQDYYGTERPQSATTTCGAIIDSGS